MTLLIMGKLYSLCNQWARCKVNKKEFLYFSLFYHFHPQDVMTSFKAVHCFPGGVVGIPKTDKSLAVPCGIPLC